MGKTQTCKRDSRGSLGLKYYIVYNIIKNDNDIKYVMAWFDGCDSLMSFFASLIRQKV